VIVAFLPMTACISMKLGMIELPKEYWRNLGFPMHSTGESLCLKHRLSQNPSDTDPISYGFDPFFCLGFGAD
jgi:hypothetical protein